VEGEQIPLSKKKKSSRGKHTGTKAKKRGALSLRAGKREGPLERKRERAASAPGKKQEGFGTPKKEGVIDETKSERIMLATFKPGGKKLAR